MKKDVDVAIVFSRKHLEKKNITVLVPEEVVTGKCIKNSMVFVDDNSNKEIKNMDEANYQNEPYGFYYATSLKELEKQYKTKDLKVILQKYLESICTKVHYYVHFDDNCFESYLLRSSSVEEFNKNYSVNFKYTNGVVKDETLETEEHKDTKINPNVCCDDLISGDIFTIREGLKNGVLFQERAIEKIIKALYTNYILGNKNNNILISGPTGVGKTKALKTIMQCSNHPIVYCSIPNEYIDENYDASYIFNNILFRLRDMVVNDDKMDNHYIVILDDFDKLEEFQKYDFQEELICFFNRSFRDIKTNRKVKLDVSKITFIVCGNFDTKEKNINVPKDFYKMENFKVDKNDLVLNEIDLIEKHLFLEEFLSFFQTEVLFNELDFEKSKKIISSFQNETFISYLQQLEKQCVEKIVVANKFIEEFAKYVYSKQLNLKILDDAIVNIFSDIMVDSLEYLGMPTKLTINDEILQNNKKGYQFTLKK